MKIAYIIPKLKDSGLTRIPFWLSKNFYPDNQVKIFYFSDTHSQDKLLHFDAPVQKISFTSFCKELNDYDVIHSHGLKPDVYLALNYDNISAVKITTIHGYHVEDLIYEKNRIFGWIFGNLWDYYCGKLDCLVCLTKTMQTYYQQRLKSTNIKFIFNGINCDLYSNYDKKNNLANIEKEKKIKIVTVSSLNRRKGIDQLIKLLKKNKRYYLTAIGGSNEDIAPLKELSKKLGVDKRCQFLSFRENPWDIAVDSDVFIFPSRSEGFGLALVEAAILEIPIICSDIPTFREMFNEDEVTFFELDDIDDLNRKILSLDQVCTKSYKAKLKVEEKFTILTMCNNYYRLYQDVLKNL